MHLSNQLLKELILLATTALLAFMLANCALIVATSAGAGTVAYIDGEYSKNIEANIKQSYQAVLAGIKDSNYTVISKNAGLNYAEVTAKTKTTSGITNSTTSIKVAIEKLTNHASKISIRFGVFGDQSASEDLMSKIDENT